MNEILKLYFDKNQHNYLVFLTEHYDLSERSLFQYVYVKYKNDQEINITYDWFSTIIINLKEALEEASNNLLQLDPSITKDIGYERNEISYKITKNILIDDLAWKGNKFLIFDTNGDDGNSGSLWIYNDKKEQIIIEITPSYPYLYRQTHLTEPFLTFEEWMSFYKPLLLMPISKEIAEQWIQQINHCMEQNF